MTGSRVLGRAFAEAWRQANATSTRQGGGAGADAARDVSSAGLTLDEACRILNVTPPKGAETDMKPVISRFKRLFDQNNPDKGGSFYLQSKVLRARERIEMEVRDRTERSAVEEELRAGFKPQMYRERNSK